MFPLVSLPRRRFGDPSPRGSGLLVVAHAFIDILGRFVVKLVYKVLTYGANWRLALSFPFSAASDFSFLLLFRIATVSATATATAATATATAVAATTATTEIITTGATGVAAGR
jgi:hypothetical protein